MRDWREVKEEATGHISDLRRMMMLAGRSPAEVDAAVETELKRMELLHDAVQPSRRLFAGIGRDLVHAVRLIASKRGYAAVVVLTLAVGIGGCAAARARVGNTG